MEIILAVIAVVIIVAIIAVLFLRKKQTPLEDTPVVTPQHSPTPTPVEQVMPTEPVAQTATDSLANAQSLMDEQRYDEAAQLIKKALIANPKNTKAMFKLLQIYGLTDNQTAFDQLHKKIHESGDTQVIADADELNTLLKADVAPPPQPTPAATPAEPLTSQPTPTDTDFSLDFDDFQSNQSEVETSDGLTPLDSGNEPVSETLTLGDEMEAVSDFELSFDEPATASSGTTEDDSLEFSFDEQQETSTAPNQDSEGDLDFSFDLDTQLNDQTTDNELSFDNLEETEIQPTPSEISFDFDITDNDDSSLFSEPLEQQTTQSDDLDLEENEFLSDELNLEEDAFAFELGEDKSDDKATVQPDDNAPLFDLDDESGTEVLAQQQEQTIQEQSNSDTADADELLLDDEFDFSDSNESFADTADLTEQDDVLQSSDADFSFNLDDEIEALEMEDASSTPQNAEPIDSISDDTFFIDDEPAIGETTEQVLPSTDDEPSEETKSPEFDFVDGLDSADITLSLAQQYIDLGEHDSAKRLLTEVVQTGNDSQQQTANKLLTHII